MQHVYGRIVTGTILTGLLVLTSCSSRPHELRRFTDAETAHDGAPSATSTEMSPSARAPARTPEVDGSVPDVGTAVLTSEDVAAEGVSDMPRTPVEGLPSPLGECLADLERGAPDGRGGTSVRAGEQWKYPTGSRLRHYVLGYPGGDMAARLGRAATCGTRTVTLPERAEHGAAGWCASGPEATCAAVLNRGHRLSLIAVSGTTEQRAIEAVARLAPIAADRLRGDRSDGRSERPAESRSGG